MKKIIITGIIAALFLVGCGGGSQSTVDGAISKLEKALDKVDKNKGSMTPEAWQALEAEMEEPLKIINAALENNELGMMGALKVIGLVGRWAVVAMEYGVGQLEQEVSGYDWENLGKEIEKSVDEFSKAIESIGSTKNVEEAED
ncbi:MAG: hypothetical protein FWD56_06530 [Bacteroidales bacterium]|nr:hypothetical protein [Bacteroidales bacterium]